MSARRADQSIDDMTQLCLRMINGRLAEAASVAKAALIFAESGALDRALRTALDVEEPIRDARTLLNAACLLRRMAGEGEGNEERF